MVLGILISVVFGVQNHVWANGTSNTTAQGTDLRVKVSLQFQINLQVVLT